MRSAMSTIMETARRGEITPMMKKIAEKENVPAGERSPR